MKTISSLLNPISKETFLKKFYEKEVLIIRREDKNYYKSILSIEKLDQYLANHDIQYPSLRLVKDGKELDDYLYLKDIDYGTSQFKGLIENDKMFQLFSDGATIVIQGLDRSEYDLGNFTRGLSTDLPFTFQSNIYITPKKSQGFVAHYDTHDVFVLQISGSKKWQIFEPECVHLPTKNEKFDSKTTDLSNLKETHNFDLLPGDLIYIPRGFVHKAAATNEDSIHITLGIFPERWYGLLRFIGMESYIEDEIKKTLPLNLSTGNYDHDRIKIELLDKIKKLLSEERIDKILEKYSHKVLKRRKSSDYQRFSDLINLSDINLTTNFRLRKNIVYQYTKNSSYIELRFYYKSIKLPVFTDTVIEDILTKRKFCCEDLTSELNNESRLVLVKKLLKEGLIRIIKDE